MRLLISLFAVAGCLWHDAVLAADAPALLHQYGCDACHAEVAVATGPSWAEVAAKYRGNEKAVAIVSHVILKGRHGNGPWPMPPSPQVPEADAKTMAGYVLSIRN